MPWNAGNQQEKRSDQFGGKSKWLLALEPDSEKDSLNPHSPLCGLEHFWDKFKTVP